MIFFRENGKKTAFFFPSEWGGGGAGYANEHSTSHSCRVVGSIIFAIRSRRRFRFNCVGFRIGYRRIRFWHDSLGLLFAVLRSGLGGRLCDKISSGLPSCRNAMVNGTRRNNMRAFARGYRWNSLLLLINVNYISGSDAKRKLLVILTLFLINLNNCPMDPPPTGFSAWTRPWDTRRRPPYFYDRPSSAPAWFCTRFTVKQYFRFA